MRAAAETVVVAMGWFVCLFVYPPPHTQSLFSPFTYFYILFSAVAFQAPAHMEIPLQTNVVQGVPL